MRIVVFGGYSKSLVNFRGPLIQTMINRGHSVVACAAEEDETVRSLLARWGATYHPLPLNRRGVNPFKDMTTLRAIHQLLLRTRADLILSYTLKPVIYGSIAASLSNVSAVSMITGLGSVFSDTGPSHRGMLRLVLLQMLRLSLRGNRVVFFQNSDDLNLFRQWKLVRDDQAVLIDGSGVDLDYFQPSEPTLQPPVFVLIARLIREKGIVEFVEAARELRRRYPYVKFRLVGGYEIGPNAIKPDEVSRWVSEGVIEYVGEVDDVRPFLAESTAVVLPSYYREGIPRSLLEALAVGRPVITSDMPGCRETVREGWNGFLIPPRNVRALANAMEILIRNPDLALKFAGRSRQLAEARFDVRRVNARILEAIGL